MVRECFQIARTWGIQPESFWSMSLEEWFWEFDVKRTDRTGMTDDDYEDLYQLLSPKITNVQDRSKFPH